MARLLYRLGGFAVRRRWGVIGAWLALLAVAAVTCSMFAGSIRSSITVPDTKTAQTQQLLEQHSSSSSGDSASVVVATRDGSAFTEAQRDAVAALFKRVAAVSGVKSATDGFAVQQDLADQQQQVRDARTQVTTARQQLAAARTELSVGKEQIAQARAELAEQQQAASAAGASAAVSAQLAQAQAAIDAQQQQLDASAAQITQQAATLRARTTQVEQNEKLLQLSSNIRYVSQDDSAAIGTVEFAQSGSKIPASTTSAVRDLIENAQISGVNVYASDALQSGGESSIISSNEIIGIVIAAIVLFLMLRTIIGAAVPLVSALLGVGVGTLGALSFSSLVEFISVTPILGVMLGLAVGIDYSLFILNRHRTQLQQGMELTESIRLANGTSGNAVVFAGATVIVALLALNITGIPFLGLMGTVAAAAVLVAILLATTFTPALLSVIGMRILRRKERRRIGGEVARTVPTTPMRTWRAIVTLVAGIAVLGTIALPATQMRLGLPDASSNPTTSSSYKAFTITAAKFGPGTNGPLLVVAELPTAIAKTDVTTTEVRIASAIARNDAVSAVAPVTVTKDRTIIAYQVIPKAGPESVSTEQLVQDLRDQRVSISSGTVTLGVAGTASANIDVSEQLADVLPLYLAVVIGLSMIILIIVFRSILVPVTATAGFILSVLAAFGGLTAIYQFGWLGDVFGVHDPAPLLSFMPIIEIGILFGLAMDYQLFLVSGMREAYAHGADARTAVQRGLHAGRAVVTAAAIIMIAVFAGFVFSDDVTTATLGFGLAFGVLVDAFVVRMLLIPAAMHLLGRSAWWIPKWLDRILPDVDVEGAKLQVAAGTTDHDRGGAAHRAEGASTRS